MKKLRSPTVALPVPDDSSFDEENLTEYELQQLAKERQKVFFYRMAQLENSQDLFSLLILARDRKMQNLVQSFVEGSLLWGSVLFATAAVTGTILAPGVIAAGLVGGGLIQIFGQEG